MKVFVDFVWMEVGGEMAGCGMVGERGGVWGMGPRKGEKMLIFKCLIPLVLHIAKARDRRLRTASLPERVIVYG